MAAWNLSGAIAAVSTNSKPEDFVYKIAPKSSPDFPYMSAKSLESAKMVCGRREVVTLNGEIVWSR